ncbi:hypothetical protein LARI1_G002859 [Lachnellula arida]|uniref:Uncharacterized protein n=1 Tax=Lachnellula arida TaxID=1316785 RepID=A0A8T9BJW9_9HELO|nr:hypothetical protein LARI1_G002859 [Lachnellula arida]
MTDVLFALQGLEEQERARRPTNSKQKRGQSRTSRRKERPPPPPTTLSQAPSTSKSDYASSVRSESQGPSSRRISFAEPARPSATSKRIFLPTLKDSLASGFPFDPRLQKYGVAEGIWERFQGEIVALAEVPKPTWLWVIQRKEVVQRIKRELQYDGDLKRKLKFWNRAFRQMGFQVDLALPGEHLEDNADPDGDEPKNPNAKRDGKRFRMVITPNAEKATSVYSRSSSLTRSVTGEGNLQKAADAKKATVEEARDDDE